MESGEYDAHGRRGSPPAIRRRGRKHRFRWYPLGYQKADGSFNSGALGKWGYVWFIGQTNASTARSLVISGTSLNLQTKTNQEAAKDIYLNVRCVKNYTK